MLQVDVDYLKKAKKRRDYSGIVIIVFLTLAGIVSFLPLIYMVSTAFKPPEEMFLYPPTFFVRNPTLQNFIKKWYEFKNVYEKEKAEILAIEDAEIRTAKLEELEKTHEEWKLRAMGTSIGCHTVVKKISK